MITIYHVTTTLHRYECLNFARYRKSDHADSIIIKYLSGGGGPNAMINYF